MSQSTFSWWGAQLGFQKHVYSPLYLEQKYPWAANPGHDDIDLIFNNNKYIKVYI
jgi:hypothetical protein